MPAGRKWCSAGPAAPPTPLTPYAFQVVAWKETKHGVQAGPEYVAVQGGTAE